MKMFNAGPKENTNEDKFSSKINYKNVQMIQRYVSDAGKILPRRITMLSAKNQRKMAKSIKTARNMALLAYNID